MQLVFSFGGRVPYAQWSSAVLGFLRDVSEPYLSIFRRFIPPIGPIDISAIVAILVLQIVRAILPPLIAGECRSGRSRGTRARRGARHRPGRQGARDVVAQRGEERDIVAGIKLVNVRNSGVAFGQLQNAGVIVAIVIAIALTALVVYFARNRARPWIWLPTGMLLGGALGNVVDRLTEGAVIDFLKLPYWPAFNVADSAITIGVVVFVLLMERGDADRRSG